MKILEKHIYLTTPSLNPIQEGLIELAVTNTNPHWVEVTRAAFNAYGMNLYHSDTMHGICKGKNGIFCSCLNFS